ncbi:hypothetical protein MLD38_012669 [Melastoma candidum]|uniref:Uncharacterized protein n=1 Tax=Melastoma candidum TaxID=119954 RepID=A0ACB9RA67_9MYRT|nr:hypothetical protein MLD38_012669 [Melastoma candidum]
MELAAATSLSEGGLTGLSIPPLLFVYGRPPTRHITSFVRTISGRDPRLFHLCDAASRDSGRSGVYAIGEVVAKHASDERQLGPGTVSPAHMMI